MAKEEIHDAIRQVIKQASVDPAIRALALKDPGAAFKKVTGSDVPAGIRLNIVEEGQDLQGNLEILDTELTDEQLNSVAAAAGGTCRCGRTAVLRVR
jgi:hypothetical protein